MHPECRYYLIEMELGTIHSKINETEFYKQEQTAFCLSFICPLECKFGLSGCINNVNLLRNIHIGILQWGQGSFYKEMYGCFTGP